MRANFTDYDNLKASTDSLDSAEDFKPVEINLGEIREMLSMYINKRKVSNTLLTGTKQWEVYVLHYYHYLFVILHRVFSITLYWPTSCLSFYQEDAAKEIKDSFPHIFREVNFKGWFLKWHPHWKIKFCVDWSMKAVCVIWCWLITHWPGVGVGGAD